jgi:hypothetical protein
MKNAGVGRRNERKREGYSVEARLRFKVLQKFYKVIRLRQQIAHTVHKPASVKDE